MFHESLNNEVCGTNNKMQNYCYYKYSTTRWVHQNVLLQFYIKFWNQGHYIIIYSFSKFHTSVSFICQKSASKRLSAFKHLIGTGTSKRLSGQRSDAVPSSSGFPDASSCLSSWKGNEVWFNSLTKFKTQLLIYYI